MTPEGIRLLLLHLTGFAGLALNVGISVSPWRAMRSNRDSGSLRGLDTRSWPLLMYSNLFWSGYATYHGDIWQFCATLPASLVWLFFIVSAIRLLGQEEGDLAKGLEGQGWNLDVLREFRQRRLWSLELESFGGLLVGFLIMVVLGPWEIPGLEVLQTTLKPDMKAEALGLICCIGTCLAYGNPVFRLAGYVWRRDASPVFVPMTLAIFISASTWCAYGIIIERIYITIPNGIGAVVALAQLVLRAIFPGTSTSETSQAKLDMAKWVYEDYLKWQRNYRRQSAVVSSDEPSAKGPRLSADVII